MQNVISDGAIEMNVRSKTQASQGAIVQGYCQAIIQQPEINLGEFEKLKEVQQQINLGMTTATDNANYYLGTVQPQIITNIANIENYFTLNRQVSNILPPSATKEEWINILKVLEEEAQIHYLSAKDTSDLLTKYYGKLGADVASFNTVNNRLNSLLDGNEGVLASLEADLDDLDSKIAGTIAAAVLSGLTVAGGIILAIVGAVGAPFTGGASGKLVALGVVVTGVGIGGAVGSGIALANLYDQKSNLLHKQEQLKGEVQALTGVLDAYRGLGNQASGALTATLEMRNAWEFLGNNINSLIRNLEKGQTDKEAVRKLFVGAADGSINTIMHDVNIIKAQMTGVETKTAPNGTDISTFIRKISKGDVPFGFYN